jgi:hypothetical protein
MLAVYLAFLAVRLHEVGFPHLMRHHHALSFLWGCFVAATLPIYMLFAATRFPSGGARWAFGAAIAAHLLFQAIGIGMLTDTYVNARGSTVIEMAAVAGLVVPAWVYWRQRMLRRRVLSGAHQ